MTGGTLKSLGRLMGTHYVSQFGVKSTSLIVLFACEREFIPARSAGERAFTRSRFELVAETDSLIQITWLCVSCIDLKFVSPLFSSCVCQLMWRHLQMNPRSISRMTSFRF